MWWQGTRAQVVGGVRLGRARVLRSANSVLWSRAMHAVGVSCGFAFRTERAQADVQTVLLRVVGGFDLFCLAGARAPSPPMTRETALPSPARLLRRRPTRTLGTTCLVTLTRRTRRR